MSAKTMTVKDSGLFIRYMYSENVYLQAHHLLLKKCYQIRIYYITYDTHLFDPVFVNIVFCVFFRSVPLGEQFCLWGTLGAKSLAVAGAGSLQPGHGHFPSPQAKWPIQHMAPRAGQAATRPLLHRHTATHHRVSACLRAQLIEFIGLISNRLLWLNTI